MNVYRFLQRASKIVGGSFDAIRAWKDLDNPTKNQINQLLGNLCPIEFRGEIVRIGSKRDGGYVVPSEIYGVDVCFSPGVGPTCDFEMELASAGIKSFCCDGSIKKLPREHHLISFESKYLSAYPRENYLTLESWVNSKLKSEEKACLQMDIEGDEWEILSSSSPRFLARFDVLVIEFHDFHKLFSHRYLSLYSSVLEKLLSAFTVIDFNPNNYGFIVTPNFKKWIPSCFEMTFLNINLLERSQESLSKRNRFNRSLKKRNDKYWFKYPVPW